MQSSYHEFVPYGSSFSGQGTESPARDGQVGVSSEFRVAKDVLRPVQIKEKLDEYVVGQDKAKRAISVAVYNHYKRTAFGNREIKKSNILMVGPTGSGKTYLVETLARVMNMPVALCSATTLTEAGYIGEDVESVVGRLFDICDHDVEKTQKGIIFIDEIDTSDILFICGGAFPDAEKIISKRINKSVSGIGFGCPADKEAEEVKDNLLLHVTTDDLRKFGMLPELLGTLPVIAPLEALSADTLIKILSIPKGCLLSQYQQLLAYDGIRLLMEEDAIRKVAELALKKETGARSLRAIMEDVLEDLMFELPGKDIEEITITGDFVDKKKPPVIRERTIKQ